MKKPQSIASEHGGQKTARGLPAGSALDGTAIAWLSIIGRKPVMPR